MKDPWRAELSALIRNEGLERTSKRLGSTPITVRHLVDGGVVRESVLKRILASLASITQPSASSPAAALPSSSP